MAELLPALDRVELAMLGQRDGRWRRQFNVASLRDAGVWLSDWREIAVAPETAGAQAAERRRQGTRRWWLHIDLDVLDPEEFPAQGLPEVEDEPNGLTWNQLTSYRHRCRGPRRVPRDERGQLRPGPRPRPIRRP